jgi:hypothetical protein
MDYRTGHSIISGTNTINMARKIRRISFLIEIMVSFANSVIETAPGSGVYTPNTTVASAKGYDTNGVIDYYDALSRTESTTLLMQLHSKYVNYIKLFITTLIKNWINFFKSWCECKNPFVVLAKEQRIY